MQSLFMVTHTQFVFSHLYQSAACTDNFVWILFCLDVCFIADILDVHSHSWKCEQEEWGSICPESGGEHDQNSTNWKLLSCSEFRKAEGWQTVLFTSNQNHVYSTASNLNTMENSI
ncbi:hypothetical protein ILYODFUR_013984 [Ilyodon furcidens]|uniref:Uncharacterized protein n=1 Tax=Ilyodon furcidens TaxID=33524 RepID=A0ABV0UGC7_9TELE